MKSKDELIEGLLITIDGIAEEVEDIAILSGDFIIIQQLIENLREEIISLSEE